MNPAFKIEGLDIFVEGAGDETIVMLHGWPDTCRLWDAQVEHLKSRYRCVRFTLPGFDAKSPREAVPLLRMVEIIQKIVDRVSPDRKVTLLLHDWGCLFGYQYYLRQPQRVSRIIGVDVGDPTTLPSALKLHEMLIIFAYQGWLALAWVIGGRIGDGMTRLMARAARCPADPQQISARMTYPYYLYWTGGYGKKLLLPFMPACPMLYIYAKRKPFRFHSPDWLKTLAAKPGNQVLAFDTGHWVMNEQPQRFNQAIGGWLESGAT